MSTHQHNPVHPHRRDTDDDGCTVLHRPTSKPPLSSSTREWLDSVSTELPLQPPFRLTATGVQAGGIISRGRDHEVVGVELMTLDQPTGQEMHRSGAFTAAQARALARALDRAADEADARTWFASPPRGPGALRRSDLTLVADAVGLSDGVDYP